MPQLRLHSMHAVGSHLLFVSIELSRRHLPQGRNRSSLQSIIHHRFLLLLDGWLSESGRIVFHLSPPARSSVRRCIEPPRPALFRVYVPRLPAALPLSHPGSAETVAHSFRE